MVLPVSPNPISVSQIATEIQILSAGLTLSHPRIKTIISDWTNPITMSSLHGKSWPLIHGSTYSFFNPVGAAPVTVPAGANFVSMKLWGGGGGGGACMTAGVASGGGGAGAFIWVVGACTPGETLTYQVGGGGGGGLTASGAGAGGGGASWVYNSTRGFYYLIAPGGGGGGTTGNQASDTGGHGGNGAYGDGLHGLNGGSITSNPGTLGNSLFVEDGGFGGVNSTTPAHSGGNGTFLQGGLGGDGAYTTRPSNGGVGGGGAGGTGSLAGGVVGGGGGGGGAGYFGGGGGAHVSTSGGAGGGAGSYYGYANSQIFTVQIAFQINNDAKAYGNTMPTYPAPNAQSVDLYGNYGTNFYGRGGAARDTVGNGNAGSAGYINLQFFTL